MSQIVNPVHVGRALESLRNSDFNTVSAMGEVIDNSIEADAKNIRIKIKKEKIRDGVFDLTEIAFGDDGVGMDKDTLHQCLQLGYSSRYNDRKGIGRFGVGMTLGAITQSTRIEVYSKTKGGEWNFTYLDLVEMKDNPNPIIPDPKQKSLPKEYASLAGETGTLVIWSNLDREDATIDEMIIWIGRTYRKFIGVDIVIDGKVTKNKDQRHIFLDDEEISAYDPLYAIKTTYNTETSRLATPIKIQEEIHQFEGLLDKKHGNREITIQFALTPEKWRNKGGGHDGNSPDNRKRLIPDNEGVSILRNNREIFYGPIAYFNLSDKLSGRGFIPPDRFWGAEISFDAELDHWFSVKNIKVGARPLPELRKALEDAMSHSIYSYRKEIRKFWKQIEVDENVKSGGATSGTSKAEDTLKRNNPSKPNPEDIDKVLKESGEKREEVLKILKQKMSERPYTFVKSENIDRRGDFLEATVEGETALITLNMNHPFFRKFYESMRELEEKAKDDEEIKELCDRIQTICYLLLGTFVAAQRDFNLESTSTAEDFIEKLMHNWTFHLSKNLDALKDTD